MTQPDLQTHDGGVRRPAPALQTHKVGANLVFDEHGLQPYWGVVNAFEPDHDEDLDAFDALGQQWTVERTSYWHGKLADPQGRFEDGLYEYRYQIAADDETGDRDATVAFRAGYPGATHVDTGEPIQSLPDDLPECLRIQVQSTNVDVDDVLPLLRAFFAAVGVNPDYVTDPHDWSRITAFEGYVRVDRDATEGHLTGYGGLVEQLAQFGSGEGLRGEHTWDHEEHQGHYEAVALDADTLGMVLGGQAHAKRIKSYHPQRVRSEAVDPDEDPLYHPKFEVQLWQDEEDPIPWTQADALRREFQTLAANLLQWSGIGIDADSDAFVTDAYYDAGWTAEDVRLTPNPIPDLQDELATRAGEQLLDPAITPAEFEAIEAVADGGASHYREIADAAGVSTSTVYRAVARLPLLESDRGTIRFPDLVTRERVCSMIQGFRSRLDDLQRGLQDVADGIGRLTGSGSEPSALERWMDAHGAVVAGDTEGLHFEFPGRDFSEPEIVEILRSGYRHAVQAGLEGVFRDATVTYLDTVAEERRKNWQIVVQRFGRDRILRDWSLPDTPTA